MPMTSLPNLIPVSPIAATGTNRRAELGRRLKLSSGEELVQDSWQIEHPDAIVLETLQTKNFCPGTRMSFCDLLSSSDMLICKPGYGSFVEAACSGTPVLHVARADWPEAPALIEWLQRHSLCREVSRQMLEQGRIAEELEEIWKAPHPSPIIPESARQEAERLTGKLDL